MKFKSLLIAAVLTSSISFGQSSLNKLSVGLNYGINGVISAPIDVNTSNSHHIGLNTRYMFNTNLGLMLGLGYDLFPTAEGTETTNQYASLNIQGVYNIGSLFKLPSKRFGLLLHAGGGVATMWNKDFGSDNATDPYIKGNDDIITLNVGLTPQFKINERFSVNIDLAYAFNLEQDRSFNWSYVTENNRGSFYTASVGLTYYIGKNDRHFDWPSKDVMPVVEEVKVVEAVEPTPAPVVEPTPEPVVEAVPEPVKEEPVATPAPAVLSANNVEFLFASYALSDSYKAELENVVSQLKANPTMNILVTGYTDEVGGVDANIILSRKRADAVKSYIVAKGVSAARITTKGLGKTIITLPNGQSGMFRMVTITQK
jgi:OOP family OmpA-OmpF porin